LSARHKLWDVNNLPVRRPGRKTPLDRAQMVFILSNPKLSPRILAAKFSVSERAIRRVRESRYLGSIPIFTCPVCDGKSIGRMIHRDTCERRADAGHRAQAVAAERAFAR
jgi:hypothetical protein